MLSFHTALKPEITITEHQEEPKVKTIFLKRPGIARVACCPDGNMIVWNKIDKYLYKYNGNGELIMKLPLSPEWNVQDIAVRSDGSIVIISHFVRVFNSDGKLLKRFSIPSPTRATLQCATTDGEGHVVVSRQKQIHVCAMGTLVCTPICQNTIKRMTVNSKNQILYTYTLIRYTDKSFKTSYDKVVAIDYSGKKKFTFIPAIAKDATRGSVKIQGIVCDTQDNIYVSICSHHVQGQGIICHIHQYSPTGKFVKCVHTETGNVCDLSIATDGTLILAKK